MKYIKLLLLLCLFYTPFSHAVDLPPNNSWSWKHHYKMREQERLKAMLVKQINESGSSKTISAIVETKPTASKVGSSMMKRVSHVARTPGVQLIGVLAVTELLEAIGWVMEDGTYVKYKAVDNTNCKYLSYIASFGDADAVCGLNAAAKNAIPKIEAKDTTYNNYTLVACYRNSTDPSSSQYAAGSCTYSRTKISTGAQSTTGYSVSPKLNPNPQEPETKKIPLTEALLGAAMMGKGYNDPVDPDIYNDHVNTDQWTGVEDAYTPDDSGIGNELAKELEDKADNAPQTPDGKSSTFTDSKYQDDLSTNDTANDRTWQSGDGTEGSTDSSQTTDPETGTTTNTGTFKLPAFCDWAMTMCQWYKDWTSSDQVYKDHMTKTEEHQTEEKSFWESVKEWFDWTKEPVDDEPDSEQEEPDTQGIFDKTFDTAFSLSKQCPPDIPYSFNTQYFSGSFNLNMNWLCIIFTALGYPLVFASHCIGMWILYQAVIQREIKW